MLSIKRWYLYDFANSFASSVIIFYYPLMLAERGASDVWIGVSASIATIILFIILPYLGAWSDRTCNRITVIRVASILMIVSLFTLAFILQSFEKLNTTLLLLVSSLYILFMASFQGCFAFYSALLRDMTNSDNNIKVSGIGLGLGLFGNALALAIIGFVTGGSAIILGLSGKPLALLLGGVTFILLSLPFLYQKEEKKIAEIKEFSFNVFFKKIFQNKKILYFIIGYALLSDAILTFQVYLTLFVKRVFDLSDGLTIYVGIVGLLFATVGGFLANLVLKKVKNKEKTLIIAAFTYALCFGLVGLIPSITTLVFIVISVSGLAYGLVFSFARVIYSEITPEKEQAEFFSIYTVFERAASVLGPLIWLAVFFSLKHYGESIQYRGSVLFLMLICLLGTYCLIRSKKLQSNL